ncbi:hypothetical protein [Streptomyces sp. BE133]|uniref:hypothetical protein n=1 Tax=Streptomyces sp. BE133 TaxID=3002523 RepID=UPI002E77CC69|nr:hypothetical protein [Streptomyces sp. BE133]MEE1805691.1 hypothetical protein [Streptomyces sp. BE133]
MVTLMMQGFLVGGTRRARPERTAKLTGRGRDRILGATGLAHKHDPSAPFLE